MAKFTIDLPDKLVAGLQAVVERYNANQGAALTVASFLRQHIAEIAISDALAAEQQQLQAQAETDLRAAVQAVRDRLMTGEEL